MAGLDFNLNMTEKDKKLFSVMIVVVVIAVFYLLFLAPLWDNVSRLNKEIKQTKLDITIAKQKGKLFEVLNKGDLKPTTLSKEEQTLQFLKGLSRAAADSGLELSLIQPVPEAGDRKIGFKVLCSGSYQSFYRFIKLLRHQDMDVFVDNLNITGGGSRTPELSIEMALTAHY